MRRDLRILILIAFLSTDSTVYASDKDCTEHFFGGLAPVLTNPKLAEKTRELCFSGFTLLHSGVTRGPLWSAEDLTREHLKVAVGLPRPASNAFHEEGRLPQAERSSLDDYRRSGYDRGHMSPNGDMPDPEAQEESFTLANIFPQEPCNNEVLWEGVESAVRGLAVNEGEVFIVTGPAFKGAELSSLKGRVMVPTHIFKAIYIPSRNAAGAYWAPNDASQDWEVISIQHLRELTGIDPFPGVDERVKSTLAGLPSPVPNHGCRLGGKKHKPDGAAPDITQLPFDWYRRHRHARWFKFVLRELAREAR